MRRLAVLAVVPFALLLVGFHTPPTDVTEVDLYTVGARCLKQLNGDLTRVSRATTPQAYRRHARALRRHASTCGTRTSGTAVTTPEGEQAQGLMERSFAQYGAAGTALANAATARIGGNDARAQSQTRKAGRHLRNADRLLTQADGLLHTA